VQQNNKKYSKENVWHKVKLSEITSFLHFMCAVFVSTWLLEFSHMNKTDGVADFG
jgi:ABC-type molybdate transport system permease subunit